MEREPTGDHDDVGDDERSRTYHADGEFAGTSERASDEHVDHHGPASTESDHDTVPNGETERNAGDLADAPDRARGEGVPTVDEVVDPTLESVPLESVPLEGTDADLA
jgi:hypothetical protein